MKNILNLFFIVFAYNLYAQDCTSLRDIYSFPNGSYFEYQTGDKLYSYTVVDKKWNTDTLTYVRLGQYEYVPIDGSNYSYQSKIKDTIIVGFIDTIQIIDSAEHYLNSCNSSILTNYREGVGLIKSSTSQLKAAIINGDTIGSVSKKISSEIDIKLRIAEDKSLVIKETIYDKPGAYTIPFFDTQDAEAYCVLHMTLGYSLTLKDIYSFSNGSYFEYTTENIIQDFYDYNTTGILKYSIAGKKWNGDTLSFIRIGSRTTMSNSVAGIVETDFIDTIIVIDSAEHPLNKYSSSWDKKYMNFAVYHNGAGIHTSKESSYELTTFSRLRGKIVNGDTIGIVHNAEQYELDIEQRLCGGEIIQVGNTIIKDTGSYTVIIPNEENNAKPTTLNITVTSSTGFNDFFSFPDGSFFQYDLSNGSKGGTRLCTDRYFISGKQWSGDTLSFTRKGIKMSYKYYPIENLYHDTVYRTISDVVTLIKSDYEFLNACEATPITFNYSDEGGTYNSDYGTPVEIAHTDIANIVNSSVGLPNGKSDLVTFPIHNGSQHKFGGAFDYNNYYVNDESTYYEMELPETELGYLYTVGDGSGSQMLFQEGIGLQLFHYTGFYEGSSITLTGAVVNGDTLGFVEPLDNYFITLEQDICKGDSIYVGDSIFTESGDYTVVLKNQYAGDSIVTLHLSVLEADSVFIEKSICEGSVYSVGNEEFSETGEYTIALNNSFGCDSVINLKLTVNEYGAQFEDFFSFPDGSYFQYQIENSQKMGGTVEEYSFYVSEKTWNGDTLSYVRNGEKLSYQYWASYGAPGDSYDSIITGLADTIIVAKSDFAYLNACESQFVEVDYDKLYNTLFNTENLGSKGLTTRAIYNDTLRIFGGNSGDNIFFEYTEGDQVCCDSITIQTVDDFGVLYTKTDSQFSSGLSFVEGLGLVNSMYSYVFTNTYTTELTGAIVNGDTIGTISPKDKYSVDLYKNISLSDERLKIYPNPATIQLYIEFSNDGVSLYNIYNEVGVKVKSGELYENKQLINISSLSAGIYVFELVSLDGSKQIKLLFITK